MVQPVHRWINIFLSLVYVFFGALQWNDPDPWLWIPVYLLPAGLCLLAFRGKLIGWLNAPLMVAYSAGALLLWPDQYAGLSLDNGYFPAIEEAREALGLLICVLAFAYHLLLHRLWLKRKNSRR